MASRMERYYELANKTSSRSERNQALYKNVYEDAEYTNIEGIASIGRTSHIDVNQIKAMLKSREDYQKSKDYRQLVPTTEEPVNNYVDDEVTSNQNYDIRDVLNKAKKDQPNDDKPRSTSSFNYDVLKSLDEAKKKDYHDYKNLDDEALELKTLMGTAASMAKITNNLNKPTSNLLEDLKATDDATKVTSTDAIKALLEEEKRQYEEDNNNDVNIDKSFFTNSMNLKKEDFNGDDKEEKPHSKGLLICLILVLALLVSFAIYFGYIYFVRG